jgi:hypothetical protein
MLYLIKNVGVSRIDMLSGPPQKCSYSSDVSSSCQKRGSNSSNTLCDQVS